MSGLNTGWLFRYGHMSNHVISRTCSTFTMQVRAWQQATMTHHWTEAPDLTCMYYVKLREAYDAEGKDPNIMK
ncbi:hypothetical protein C2845_PM15G08740 [Panicum miliaceum]|uniref:Uncharacterized protein n=1 Tax=Panicum miliaceum TaxID=4540 RepID=A0A3L6Q9B9_PANMI|nr:hypothetical protein C2845_PM15G08740 [Panicum miliaceum]